AAGDPKAGEKPDARSRLGKWMTATSSVQIRQPLLHLLQIQPVGQGDVVFTSDSAPSLNHSKAMEIGQQRPNHKFGETTITDPHASMTMAKSTAMKSRQQANHKSYNMWQDESRAMPRQITANGSQGNIKIHKRSGMATIVSSDGSDGIIRSIVSRSKSSSSKAFMKDLRFLDGRAAMTWASHLATGSVSIPPGDQKTTKAAQPPPEPMQFKAATHRSSNLVRPTIAMLDGYGNPSQKSNLNHRDNSID
ncbi:hypothetical protein ACLOJK_006889, partial [Asimina triloba]